MSLPLVPDSNHPAFPTRRQVDDWETKRSASMPRTWRGSGRGDWDARRIQNSRKNIIDTLASAPTQGTQNSAARPNGEQAESRMTNTEC